MNRPAALPEARIFDQPWTADQLRAVEAAQSYAGEDTQHYPARRALFGYALCVDVKRIRAMVSDVMGGIEGTYYITAALCDAHLAISFPHLLTDYQRDVLLSPLVAGEMAVSYRPAEVVLAAA